MTWRSPIVLAALCLSAAACDRLPFLGGRAADTTAAATAEADSQPAAVTPPPTPRPVPAAARAALPALMDEPWTPVDTGTIAPGMTRDEVVALWGPPVAERTLDGRGYLYFRNGCEVTCGTFDVVFLEQGQVADVIARGPGHHYSGTSSSPVGRVPAPTPPGSDTLTVNSTP